MNIPSYIQFITLWLLLQLTDDKLTNVCILDVIVQYMVQRNSSGASFLHSVNSHLQLWTQNETKPQPQL